MDKHRWSTALLLLTVLISLCPGGLADLFDMQRSVTRVWHPMGDPVTGSEQACCQRFPRIVIDGSGQPVVVHIGSMGGGEQPAEIIAHRWTGSEWESLGSVAQGPVCAEYDYGVVPHVTVDSEGRPVVAWQGGDLNLFGSSWEPQPIRIRRWSGESWESVGGSSTSPESTPFIGSLCEITLDSQGRIALAHMVREEDYWELSVHRWDGVGWVELSDESSGPMTPDVSNRIGSASMTLDPEGRPLLLWRLVVEIPIGSGGSVRITNRLRGAFWTRGRWVDLTVSGEVDPDPPDRSPDAVLTAGHWGNPVFVWWGEEGDGSGFPTALLHTGTRFEPLRGDVSLYELTQGSGINFAMTAPRVSMAPGGMPVIAYEQEYEPFGNRVRVRRWDGDRWAEIGRRSGRRGLAGNTWTSTAQWPDVAVDALGYFFVTFVHDGAIQVMTTRPGS